ncbi:MAG: ribonuclease Y [Anaerolineaceae bacterium]|jgi:ribonuclease Y|nr:ribonuclease Y [Anaerolineae bacterium]MBL1171408.1 ribonuclease Y [Chloroflexota bacterium]MBV6465727.1 Ribonuclease Y [Anaerolineales bacterium]MCE7906626.1 ribonuclease Y [Anaerolineae bacterium CFX3]MDL1924725.1 ribonuclease Y [Anaerolineae bacterium AMX1]OQY83346.1 MAG: ribonuclease Y [Anaerolineae bacterium UTCFX3]GER79454.1 ribonuclease Y [Candidatus Denitrolinea symbiosum]GJQ38302.1 MAG: ribonuclease Y [Anaerolineaceae bacterium]
MNPIFWLILIVFGIALGAAAGYLFHRYQVEKAMRDQQEKAANILKGASEQARLIETQARENAARVLQAAEQDIKERRVENSREAERLDKRRTELENRADKLEQREQNLNKRQSSVDRRANEIDKLYEQEVVKLEHISNLSQEDARKDLFAAVEKEARADMARIYRQIEAEAREEGEKRARKLIADAIQRVASDHVAEVTSSRVTLPNEEMKGRIVGRNGRNIKAFEQAAGVDVIVDDTPESVTISCFDSVRREIARRALVRLTVDGRIHPTHIEKIIEDETRAVDKIINEAGEQAAYDANIAGLHPEVLRMMGRLKFRTSYGQNQLAHAVEVAKLAGILAAELGADVEISKQGGFLHDIGKAMDHNQEGTHAGLGAEFCKRYNVNHKVVNAIASHHHEVEQETIEAVIAEAADAISGARPGARREDLEAYIKRIKTLEDLASSFKGVQQSFAIQAGREVRIIVRPEEIDDLDSARLARDVAKKIEETMQYPGQIKVSVIRETRAVDYAK